MDADITQYVNKRDDKREIVHPHFTKLTSEIPHPDVLRPR